MRLRILKKLIITSLNLKRTKEILIIRIHSNKRAY